MPEFATPFSVKKSDRLLSKQELVRAIRFSIASEYEAIQLYEELVESIDNVEAQRLLNEIADDEKVHAGNFLRLLEILAPEEAEDYKKGREEADKVMKGEKDDD